MATTYYISLSTNASQLGQDVDHSGTSSTAGDWLELRMGNGTYAPDRHEVIKGLVRLLRFMVQGGTDGAGANIPPNTGPA